MLMKLAMLKKTMKLTFMMMMMMFLQKQLSQHDFGAEILWRGFDPGNYKYVEGDERSLFSVGVTVLDASAVRTRIERGELEINGYKHPMDHSDSKLYIQHKDHFERF